MNLSSRNQKVLNHWSYYQESVPEWRLSFSNACPCLLLYGTQKYKPSLENASATPIGQYSLFIATMHLGICNIGNNASISVGNQWEPIHPSLQIPAGMYTNDTFTRLIQSFLNSYNNLFQTKVVLDTNNFYEADIELDNKTGIDIILKMHRSIGCILGKDRIKIINLITI